MTTTIPSLLSLAAETVASAPGTSTTISLSGTQLSGGFLTWANAGAVNGTVYRFEIIDGNNRELSTGTWNSSGNTFTNRTVLIASVNGTQQTTPINATANAIILCSATQSEILTPALQLHRVTVSDANYTVAYPTSIVAYTSITATRTVTLPAASTYPAGGQVLIIDEANAAETYNIDIAASSGLVYWDGASTAVAILTNGGSCLLESNGTNWFVVSDNSLSIAAYVAGGVNGDLLYVTTGNRLANAAISTGLSLSGGSLAASTPAFYQTAYGVGYAETTTSTSFVQLGMGAYFTINPNFSGRVEITICIGYVQTTNNTNVYMNMNYGSGTAPTNGAAPTGTAIGTDVIVGGSNIGTDAIPVTLHAIVTGLTVGTTYWFDLVGKTGNGSDGASWQNITASIREF